MATSWAWIAARTPCPRTCLHEHGGRPSQHSGLCIDEGVQHTDTWGGDLRCQIPSHGGVATRAVPRLRVRRVQRRPAWIWIPATAPRTSRRLRACWRRSWPRAGLLPALSCRDRRPELRGGWTQARLHVQEVILASLEGKRCRQLTLERFGKDPVCPCRFSTSLRLIADSQLLQ